MIPAHVCVQVECLHMCAHACGDWKLASVSSLITFSTVFFDTVSHRTWGLSILLGWTTSFRDLPFSEPPTAAFPRVGGESESMLRQAPIVTVPPPCVLRQGLSLGHVK